MAASPNLKVYRNGEYVASCKYAEDAAALVANGGSVKFGHSHVIWRDTEENRAIAANSYDEAAEMMLQEVDRINREAHARVYGRTS